jgi:hypothetical protein
MRVNSCFSGGLVASHVLRKCRRFTVIDNQSKLSPALPDVDIYFHKKINGFDGEMEFI